MIEIFSSAHAKRKSQIRDQGMQLVEKAIQQFPKEIACASQFWTVGNSPEIKLHIVEAGPRNGPLIVLLHGFPENWYCWHPFIQFLAEKGFHVLAPDLRGYGLSSKPSGVGNYRIGPIVDDVKQLILAAGAKNAVVISHDWGSVIAWRLAMTDPSFVNKLVVMNGPHPVGYMRAFRKTLKQKLMSWYVLYFQLPFLPEFILGLNPWRTAENIVGKTERKSGNLTEFEVDLYASMWLQTGALKGMLNYYRALIRFGLLLKPKVVECPTLILWGEDDFALSPKMNEGLKDHWVPNLTYKTISNCSHWIQRDAPEEVKKYLGEFLTD